MIAPILFNIQKSQNEYRDLILSYKKIINKRKMCINDISMMIDDIKLFWIERLNIIEFELNELVKNYCCFLLSGAIYLGISDYEHYYFKSLGDYHFLYDPFLKLENFFHLPHNKINKDETIKIFNAAYKDTVQILTKYNNQFYILPMREIAIKSSKEQVEFLEKSFLNFLSNAFDVKFISREDFCKKYKTYEEIEENMIPYFRKYLILDEQFNFTLTLREKINLYIKSQINIPELIKDNSETEIFILSIFTWYSQIIDILSVCTRLGLNPFIRFNVTFQYLTLIMNIFIEDNELKKMIERTIVFYIFYKLINRNRFKNITFSDYCSRIKDKRILNNILDTMHDQGIDIFVDGGIKKIQTIINDEFESII